MASKNGKTALIIAEIKQSTSPMITSQVEKTTKGRRIKRQGKFSTEHTMTPNKKISFLKVDCGIIDFEDDYQKDSFIRTAKNFMIETLNPSTTEDTHPRLLCCFPSSQANRDCMSPEDCWICAVLESWQIFCQRTHLIRHLPSHASRTYHMDNEQLEV